LHPEVLAIHRPERGALWTVTRVHRLSGY
jgi:hypothetical protein